MYKQTTLSKDFINYPMDKTEFFEIARELECYHSVFATLWRLGSPIMANSYAGSPILTAEVHFDKKNKATLIYINPDLWKNLNQKQKLFIICHECLHVVFNYGFRIIGLKNHVNANIAADVSINQILEKNFLFDRKEVDPVNELCWANNSPFDKIKNVEIMKNMEYYYNLLDDEFGSKNSESFDGFFVGNHGNISEEDSQSIHDICQNLNETLTMDEKQSIKEMIELNYQENDNNIMMRGSSAGNTWIFVEKENVKPKKKWETVIKKWYSKQITPETRENEQWAVINRRLILLPRNMFIPSDREVDGNSEEKKKIEVWFFQDTSGSCYGHAKRFFKAARSLPKKSFDVKMFCFDTEIYETTLESGKLYGFGGTSFHTIEDYILKNSKTYPKAVWIITDGYGTHVYPKYPERWYIFLTTEHKNCFPPECNFFALKNYE